MVLLPIGLCSIILVDEAGCAGLAAGSVPPACFSILPTLRQLPIASLKITGRQGCCGGNHDRREFS
ncbi:MAG: hypothetical protein OXC26_04010 [Albidovulum sp.]|nr:hypothetical protein [Albidovulum sp.]